MNVPALTGACRLVIALLAVFCAPFSAFADQKRVAIVYSETSKLGYFDAFAYYQLYMNAQYQCAMAGVPYDLLDEDDLTVAANLAPYDVLVAPLFDTVTAAKRAQIVASLNQATGNGLNIVTAGWFLSFTPTGQDHPGFIETLQSLVGVEAVNFYAAVPLDLLAADVSHPAMRDYQAGEQILHYNQIWSSSWVAAGSANPASSSVLCNLKVGNNVGAAVNAITTQAGNRNVHFANEQLMQDGNLLWSALQWALYGNETPVALRLGRERSLFFARNDMDQSQFAEEVPLVHAPLLNIITDWKNQYGFTGSFYFNLGNRPSQGEFTNWAVSGPLYQQYRALGNEIGTHSYTHPDNTGLLTASQLEFEFNQSVLQIEQNLGGQVPGAAVPGAAETTFVIETVAPWLDYLSGRSAIADSDMGVTSAFGHIRPDLGMFYYCLNTSPDFTLISFLGFTLSETAQIWQQEYAQLHKNAPLPVVHWLWHDYGATGFEPGYAQAPFDVMVSTAAAGGSEFVTGEDLRRRVGALRAAQLDVTPVSQDVVAVQVGSSDAGRLSLDLPGSSAISSVDNWYAWNANKVFVPKSGGNFTVRTSGPPAQVTRISKLPQRAELLSVTGNGVLLDFSFAGEGQVVVELNESAGSLQVVGADSIVRVGSTLKMNFDSPGTHVAVVYLTGGNTPPEANSMFVSTLAGQPVSFTLDASDLENNPLQYTVGTPGAGTLQGTPPNLTYTPNPGFNGLDQFTFSVSDGLLSSPVATIFINVEATTVTVDGNLADWAGVPALINDPADSPETVDILALYARRANGQIYLAMENEGAIPQLNYGFSWYLDTDLNPGSGFAMFSIGADYLLEGSTLYRFAGANQGAWVWSVEGPVTSAVQGNTAEFSLDPAQLAGSTSFDTIFWGPSAAFGQSAIDLVPNAGFARFTGGPGGGLYPSRSTETSATGRRIRTFWWTATTSPESTRSISWR